MVKYERFFEKSFSHCVLKRFFYQVSKISLPAARLHSTSRRCSGSWFAVDLYDVAIADYHNLMALVNQKGKPWFFKRPDLDRYILLPGSIVNVGIAKQQGFHEGGGLQFEFVSGSAPYLLEHVKSPKQVRF
jgi:hypothetical protein